MADATEVKVPDIGDFDEVPVIEIHVAEGDTVAEEDPLITLESDKATMDVPAPKAGTVEKLLVSIDDKVKEGTPILTLAPAEEEGDGDEEKPEGDVEEKSDSDEAESKDGSTEPSENPVDPGREAEESTGEGGSPGREAEESTGGGEESTGEGGEESTGGGSLGPTAEEAAPTPAPQTGADETSPRQRREPASSSGAAYAGPGARRLARELNVDLADVEGSGRKGRITKEDVQAAKDKPKPAKDVAPAGIPGLDLAPWPKVDFAKYGEIERVPRSRIKKISGPNLARNWVMIPHVTHNDDADITDLEAFRKQVNSEQDVKVTMVSLLIKACVGTLRQFPEVNSSLDGDDLVIKRYFNIGFAADTPQGLLVPVVKDADRKGLLEIAGELTELSAKAREGKLAAEDMRGSTFTISSLGGIGGTSFTPIINAPEVAILGVTRSAMRPVWNGEEFEPRLILPLSLSYDHRVIDGAAAARFVAHLAGELKDLRRVLL
jgi:pyruvate dehydrogenase E2 component (dihydrolipoamide acetyltransferase)